MSYKELGKEDKKVVEAVMEDLRLIFDIDEISASGVKVWYHSFVRQY